MGSEMCIRDSVDTVAHSLEALDYCYRTMGSDRMLLGTDHPFGDGRHIRLVEELECTTAERDAIYHGNAESLLGL